ncbi:uncharacterized protein G2W53_028911 [Senna tora]|uniref:Uncharacterized protein n=1 Tax=Senna tora TaxID=362788 RepID=A0A834WA75_9FABA|nr:uncharacterized protein G2W53_028911 [Senna tora]
MAWEERGSCLNIFQKRNRGRITETFMDYEAKDLLRNRHGIGGAWIISYHIPDKELQSDLRNIHELLGKSLLAQVSETRRFALYLRTGGDLILQLESSSYGRSVNHVLTYSGQENTVGSQKPSRIMRQNTCCARAWIMSYHIPDKKLRSDLRNLHELQGKSLVAESGFDGPIGVVMAWEERGLSLNIFPMRNRGQISETFTNYEAKDLTRNGLDAPIRVVKASEERGSCLNIFRTRNRDQISETFTNYEAKHLLRNVDHVLTYSGREIMVGSHKSSRVTRQKTCCANKKSPSDHKNLHELRCKTLVAQVCETRRFSLYLRTGVDLMLQLESSWHGRSVDHVLTYSGREIASGFQAPIGVFMAWEERGSCLNIFRTRNHGRTSETFMDYEAKDLLRNHGVGGVWNMSEHIPNEKSRSNIRNLDELRGKRLVAQVSETRRFALYLLTGFDLMLQLESSWHGRSVYHALTYSKREIAAGSQKP